MKSTKSILILLSLFLIFSCEDNSVEPPVCDEGLTIVDGECIYICEEGVTECYYQGDLDVLQNIIDVNDSLSGEPLEIGFQYWNNGRLDSLYLSNNQLTTIPESIGNLSSLERVWLQRNNLISIPESICDLMNINWSSEGTSWYYSYIYNNQLCQSYPECLINQEPFTDENENGIWDESEPFEDTNQLNYLNL